MPSTPSPGHRCSLQHPRIFRHWPDGLAGATSDHRPSNLKPQRQCGWRSSAGRPSRPTSLLRSPALSGKPALPALPALFLCYYYGARACQACLFSCHYCGVERVPTPDTPSPHSLPCQACPARYLCLNRCPSFTRPSRRSRSHRPSRPPDACLALELRAMPLDDGVFGLEMTLSFSATPSPADGCHSELGDSQIGLRLLNSCAGHSRLVRCNPSAGQQPALQDFESRVWGCLAGITGLHLDDTQRAQATARRSTARDASAAYLASISGCAASDPYVTQAIRINASAALTVQSAASSLLRSFTPRPGPFWPLHALVGPGWSRPPLWPNSGNACLCQ